MIVRALLRRVRFGLLAVVLLALPFVAQAAPFAAVVMDARSGEVLYAKNADTRLHPASLTKMMTLYIAFQAIERGEVSLDTMVTVSANAAAQPPSRLGLKTGQRIALRYLIRAAAVKSANDAAAAIGDALGGNEAKFAARMTATAKALGMGSTVFRNANGLTREGHLSTARDMTLLGRHLLYDFPQYYNIFSRRTADAGVAHVASTNRRFLDAYEGADGIKTGYTAAAGFNLVASAKRGDKRIIATVFGGTSPAQRNAKVAELLDMGFGRARGGAPVAPPQAAPMYIAEAAPEAPAPGSAAKRIRVSGAPGTSPRPLPRPAAATPAAPPVHDSEAILAALASAVGAPDPAAAAAPALTEVRSVAAAVPAEAAPAAVPARLVVAAPDGSLRPRAAPRRAAPATVAAASIVAPEAAPSPAAPSPAAPSLAATIAEVKAAPSAPGFVQTAEAQPETLELAALERPAAAPAPAAAQGAAPQGFAQTQKPQPETLLLAGIGPTPAAPQEAPVVVARASTSGGRHWGISLGLHNSEFTAQRALLTTALMETDTLGEALRKVNKRPRGFEAAFMGMTEDMAGLACRRIAARGEPCDVIGP